jgi:hypothetical protein
MKVAAVLGNRRFIVVVRPESTVSDLKAEILRVYNALFPDCSSPPTISGIQTLSGCMLLEGYTVSSVLSDNDTVVAVNDSSDHTTTNPMLTLSSGLPYFRPCHGISPEGHHCSPTFAPHAMHSNTTPQMHTNFGHSYMFPSFMEAPTTRLFQSPKSSEIRTVSIQCPSPECLHLCHNAEETGNNVLSKASQYHSSTSQTVADVHLPRSGEALTSDFDVSTDISSPDLQRQVSSKVVTKKPVRKPKSKAAPSGSNTQTTGGPAGDIVDITKEQSQHVPSTAASLTMEKCQISSKRQGKSTQYNKSKCVKTVKKAQCAKQLMAKQKPKSQKFISSPDVDSSDWMSTDDDEKTAANKSV